MNPIDVPPPGNHYKPWREGEDRKLREFASAGLGARAIGRRLGRTTVAVRTRAVHLGIRLRGPQPDELEVAPSWNGNGVSGAPGVEPPRCSVCGCELTGEDATAVDHEQRRQHLACHFGQPAVGGGGSAGAMVRVVPLVERARAAVDASLALRRRTEAGRAASREVRSS